MVEFKLVAHKQSAIARTTQLFCMNAAVCRRSFFLSSVFTPKPWRTSSQLSGCSCSLFSCLAGKSDFTQKLDDSKLVKAIVYEANKGFCDSTGSTTRFSDFLGSQLLIHAGKIRSHQVLQELAHDAKFYSQMNHEQRIDLLDRVAQIQGFSCAKDIVENEIAVAEALVNGEDSKEDDLPLGPASVVFGSSERVELFNFENRVARPVPPPKAKPVPTAVDTHEESLRKEKTPAPSDSLNRTTSSSHEKKLRPKNINEYHDDWKLDTPLNELKCLTAYQKSQLQDNGFYTARSLLNHFPRAHISFESPTDTLEDGQVVSLLGTIVRTKACQIRTGLSLLEVIVKCNIGQDYLTPAEPEESVFLHVKKFFQGSRFTEYRFLSKIASGYPEGSKAAVSGKVKALKLKNHFDLKDCYELKVVREDISKLQNEAEAYPVYSSKGFLHPKKIQSYIQRLLTGLPSDLDPLPTEIRKTYQLPSLEEAYLGLHVPNTLQDANIARRRMVFDDYFYLQLAFLLQRHSPRTSEASGTLELDKWCPLCVKVLNALPFKLTRGQMKAASEIMWDLRQPSPMSRLLQGDVGCGKTIVAFLALLDVVNSGFQAALMAPTEFVVAQHYKLFLSWLELLDDSERPKVALLSGATSHGEARLIRERIASKEISLVVGTHALICGGTSFPALGLAVIDEQHRFGVVQRDRLKMAHDPGIKVLECDDDEGKVRLASTTHVLLMSATPIPRSIALTVHGDLSLSQITESPPGRQPTETFVFSDDTGRRTAYELVRSELESGGRAFFVYPLITESSAHTEQRAAVAEFEKVAAEFKDYKCVLVHGRMKSDVKNEEMRKFRDGECQILVSTKVVEVGIDVSEATIMLIENAEAYGLAQLHQLRGRVGRGTKKSFCILLSSCEAALERLRLLESTTDGFRLAEADLKMRGPGDLLGKRQSGGHVEFVLARLGEDNDILEQARSAALELLKTSLDDFPKLKQEINMRQLPKSWS